MSLLFYAVVPGMPRVSCGFLSRTHQAAQSGLNDRSDLLTTPEALPAARTASLHQVADVIDSDHVTAIGLDGFITCVVELAQNVDDTVIGIALPDRGNGRT